MISDYLRDRKRRRNFWTGECLKCKKIVKWNVHKIAAHKKARCVPLDSLEKVIFASKVLQEDWLDDFITAIENDQELTERQRCSYDRKLQRVRHDYEDEKRAIASAHDEAASPEERTFLYEEFLRVRRNQRIIARRQRRTYEKILRLRSNGDQPRVITFGRDKAKALLKEINVRMDDTSSDFEQSIEISD